VPEDKEDPGRQGAAAAGFGIHVYTYYDAQHVPLRLQIYLFGARCDKTATHFLTK
jgi:hypothetical protein